LSTDRLENKRTTQKLYFPPKMSWKHHIQTVEGAENFMVPQHKRIEYDRIQKELSLVINRCTRLGYFPNPDLVGYVMRLFLGIYHIAPVNGLVSYFYVNIQRLLKKTMDEPKTSSFHPFVKMAYTDLTRLDTLIKQMDSEWEIGQLSGRL
jgi:hypothetical protein